MLGYYVAIVIFIILRFNLKCQNTLVDRLIQLMNFMLSSFYVENHYLRLVIYWDKPIVITKSYVVDFVKFKIVNMIKLFVFGSKVTEDGLLIFNLRNEVFYIRFDFKNFKNLQISTIICKELAIVWKLDDNFFTIFYEHFIQSFQIVIFTLNQF